MRWLQLYIHVGPYEAATILAARTSTNEADEPEEIEGAISELPTNRRDADKIVKRAVEQYGLDGQREDIHPDVHAAALARTEKWYG